MDTQANTTTSPTLALVGAGYWGRNLARNFHALGALHTLCDRDPAVLEGYDQAYTGVRKTTDYDAVLQDTAVRQVAIATPAALHYRLARAALLAGKDVFVEKPLCLELEEAEELIQLARRQQRILMVGHLLQYHPCIVRLLEMVRAGQLGRLYYITSNRLNLGKIRAEENALWSFAPHDISVILALADNQLPEQVRCTGEDYLTDGVADATLTAFRFPGRLRAHIYVSWLNPFKEQKLTVVGSEGLAVFDDTRPWPDKLRLYRDYLTWAHGRVPTPQRGAGEPVPVPEAEPLREECRHFLECCATRRSPRTDGTEALRVLQVLQLAQQSLEQDGEAARPSKPAGRPDFYVHPTAVIDNDVSIGAGTKIWHFSHVMTGARLGQRCILGQNVHVAPGVHIGNNVKIQNNVSVYAGVEIEDHVFLGPSCVLTNVVNPRSEIPRRDQYQPTRIRRGATVGANATIVCGVTLGRYCFVGAGAVVTRDVPDYALVLGNPARRVGWMGRHGYRLIPDGDHGLYRCPQTGWRYQETPEGGLRCLDLPEEQDLPAEAPAPVPTTAEPAASSAETS